MGWVPTVVENEGGNRERAFDIYSRLLRDRIVIVGRPIDDVVANLIVAQLIAGRGLTGQATDLDIHAREILRIKNELNELIARHTGQPLERVERDTDRDFYMAPEEAIDYGL